MVRVLQWLTRRLFRVLFRVELRGWEHYPHNEPRLLIIANHASYLDGALLAAFLPDVPVFVINTYMAQNWWVKPFIAVTRHISIDPTNPLYLKTLIQHLKAGERVAVFPEGRISVTGTLMKVYEGPALAADKADAALLPVCIEGAQYSLLSRLGGIVRRRMFPRIRLTLLPPRRLTAIAGDGRARRRHLGRQLDAWMTELTYAGQNITQPLTMALLKAWGRHGSDRVVLEDAQRQQLSWRALFTRAFLLAEQMETTCAGQRHVGLLLPTAIVTIIAFLALHLRGRTPVMFNEGAGLHQIVSACRTAEVRVIYTLRVFAETDHLRPQIAALSEQFQVVFLEDLQAQTTLSARLRSWARARLPQCSFRRWAGSVRSDDPAVILFNSGSEPEPKGIVFTHGNMLAHVAQTRAMLDITPGDVILSALPLYHAFGLTTAVLTPLLLGAKTLLYPMPQHYHVIPELAYERRVTVLFSVNAALMDYGRYADPYDFFSVRLIVAGLEPLCENTRQLWAEKFGLRISECYGLAEVGPLLTINNRRRCRNGTVGLFVPGLDYVLEPVAGIAEGGRLCVRGASIMAGYLVPEQPGHIMPPHTERGTGWQDTGDTVCVDSDGFITVVENAR